MIILGIESTCDETSVGIVRDGREVLSNVVASSAQMHRKYGGIVPEVAAREQVKVIEPALQEALKQSKVESRKIGAIAVAYGPGLVGSLLIGVETAKALALAWDKPLIGVNHLVGHLYANWIETGPATRLPQFPSIGLVVSGGHTDLILMESHTKIKHLGETLDDAAGEVFDKVARVLGLGYPGGPEVERSARQIQKINFASQNSKSEIRNIHFPVPMSGSKDFNFSFSGLKTAVVNLVHRTQFTGHSKEGIAFAFQEAVVKSLVKKTMLAVEKYKTKSIIVGGGVSANERLREMMSGAAAGSNVEVYFPKKEYSIDNGVMIAAAAFYQPDFIKIEKLQADPGLHFA